LALAACVTAALAAGAAAAQPAGGFDWKKYDGQTITFLSSNHPWPNAVLPHLDEFKKLTGITVRVDTYNEVQMRTRLTTMLQTKSPDIDIFMTLPAREGRIYQNAGWYRDLAELAADKAQTAPDYDFSDFGESLVQRANFGGKAIGVPLNIEGPVLYYRRDVLAACHVEPPKTLDELTEAAAKLKACKPDMVPFASRGLLQALSYTFVPFFYNLGGNFDKLPQHQAYCTPVGERAIQMYTDLLGKYGPPGVSNYTFYQVTEIMGQGRAAMSFEASNEFGKVMAYPGRAADTDLSLLPPGAAQQPLVINWDIAISAFSRKPGPSWYFIQWATSREMVERLAFEGIAPPRGSVFEGEKFRKWVAELPVRQHWVDALKQMGANGRPGSAPPQVSKVPEAGEAAGTAVTKVMQGQMKPREAGCELDDKLVALIQQ
ncbi:MAG TPA: extracellular solute-binding protein, partial [Acetobacteraceae bacterium]